MADPTDLETQITDAASGPRRVKTDAGEVEAQPLPDLIQAANRELGKTAAKSRTKGAYFNKLNQGGTT